MRAVLSGAFFAGLALVSLAGCTAEQGPEPTGVLDPASSAESDEAVAEISQAAAVASGFTIHVDGSLTKFRIKNSGGTCAFADGAVMGTKACNVLDASQKFVIYRQNYDGKYQICTPGSLKQGITTEDICSSFGCTRYEYPTWEARCLRPTNFLNGKPRDYRFDDHTILSTNYYGSTYESSSGTFRYQSPLILDNDRWMTRSAGGAVVPAKYVGDASQQWSLLGTW